MMQVEVAVVPAAGLGTRMRPATRAIPKALLPVVDRPAVQHVAEEAVRAGVREVVFIVDLGVGSLIRQHFTNGETLEGLEDLEIRIAVQEEPHGLGHAVLTAREIIGDRPFFCLLADNIVRPGADVLPSLVAASDGGSVVSLREVGPHMLDRYGVAVPGDRRGAELDVIGAVEKPGIEHAPSNLGLVGRYLFTSDIIDALAGLDPGHGGEIQLTDAIDLVARQGKCRGVVGEHDLLDIGIPLGLLEAAVVLGLARPEFRDDFTAFLRSLEELR
ncbi:MAG: sugar phosphate nucleotidyltransferase [Acidimicrobiia bacterium]|nr:sugar phosphate nucleotidyltransferase [Acidimicrobiia bacterium]